MMAKVFENGIFIGNPLVPLFMASETGAVLHEFAAELSRAAVKYPDCVSLPDGTGGGARKTWEEMARNACDRAAREGRLTHTHIFDEETAEALAAETTEELRKELVQVGAMALKWILDIDSRGGR